MKPGDLVRVTLPCESDLATFFGGEVGMVIETRIVVGIRRTDLLCVMFPVGSVIFARHLLEAIDEEG